MRAIHSWQRVTPENASQDRRQEFQANSRQGTRAGMRQSQSRPALLLDGTSIESRLGEVGFITWADRVQESLDAFG